jgi:hypothetical protein
MKFSILFRQSYANRGPRVALLLVMLVVESLSVRATTILIQSPEVVVQEAPLIVEAIVTDIRFIPISNFPTGEARMTLHITEHLVGTSPTEIVIRRDAVTPDLQFLDTEWLPSYDVGERFIICLWLTKKGYSTMGLYNGKFVIEQGNIRGTSLSVDVFKEQLREIRRGDREQFPAELPRQTAQGVQQRLGKTGAPAKFMGAGTHLNGEFITWNFSWNPSYVPVAMRYNSDDAPTSAPGSSTIASLAQTAYGLWSDTYSSLTIQNDSPFTTSEGQVDNTTNVIFWQDFFNTSILARAYPYPNDPLTSTFYGPGQQHGH